MELEARGVTSRLEPQIARVSCDTACRCCVTRRRLASPLRCTGEDTSQYATATSVTADTGGHPTDENLRKP